MLLHISTLNVYSENALDYWCTIPWKMLSEIYAMQMPVHVFLDVSNKKKMVCLYWKKFHTDIVLLFIESCTVDKLIDSSMGAEGNKQANFFRFFFALIRILMEYILPLPYRPSVDLPFLPVPRALSTRSKHTDVHLCQIYHRVLAYQNPALQWNSYLLGYMSVVFYRQFMVVNPRGEYAEWFDSYCVLCLHKISWEQIYRIFFYKNLGKHYSWHN